MAEDVIWLDTEGEKCTSDNARRPAPLQRYRRPMDEALIALLFMESAHSRQRLSVTIALLYAKKAISAGQRVACCPQFTLPIKFWFA
jgi:hypothetical protein